MERTEPDKHNRTNGTQSPRIIGLVAAISVVAGSMLGVGVFLFPPIIATQSGSIGAFFLLWILGGVYALSGAVACGELGAMIPQAGGDYTFQRYAFGPSVAFASGWVLFVAIFGGSIAAMSVALFQYQVPLLFGFPTTINIYPGIPIPISHVLAIALIFLLTFLNHLGTRISTVTQVILTLIPVVLMLVLAFEAWDWSGLSFPDWEISTLFNDTTFTGMITGFLFVNFAFSGWLNIIYVAGEVRHPGKNIPRSMFISTIGIGLLYCFLCASFIKVLGFDGLASLVNVDAGTGMALETGKPILRLMVLLTIVMAITTSLNATILTSSRVAYAMAGEGAFWNGAARLSGRSRTPRHALWVQAVLASLLVLSGSFSAIIEMTSIAMLLTGTLTVASMFVLRLKRQKLTRPYRAFGYPWFPGFYLVLSLVIMVGIVIQSSNSEGFRRFYPFIGMGVLLLAYAGHYIFNRKNCIKITDK